MNKRATARTLSSGTGSPVPEEPPVATPPGSNPTRTPGWKIVLLLAATVGVCLWAVRRSPWFQQRQWEQRSLIELQQASAAHADDSVFLTYLGLRLNAAHRFGEAVPVLERAAGLDPDAPQQREEWARALLGTGQVTAAFVELRQFVGTHPRSEQGHLALGKFYVIQRALMRAEEEFTTATQLEPNNGEAWSFLAMAHSNLDDAAGALPAAEKSVGFRPRNVDDRLVLASVYARLNRNPQARSAYETACKLGPDRPETHREFALWLLDHGGTPQDGALAEGEARKAVALNTRDSKAFLVLGRILIRRHREVEAIPALEQAATINPINPSPLLALTQVCNRLGRGAEARHWSQIYLKCQQQNNLNNELQDEISRNPTDPTAHRRLARLMADWGDIAECVKHQSAALHCLQDAPPALLAAAQDLMAVSRPEDALPLVNQALTVDPGNPLAHELRGDSLLHLGQPRQAAAEYDIAVAIWPNREPLYRSKLQRYFAHHPKTGHPPASSDGPAGLR
jgi:tetratricopeptide (TPR) repeat protein